ncbi:MAG: hypothetical protein LCH84_15195 [Gemmatimonadetes bacterium]|nr:hypothetical protein [Gemmatimonadota bacterium]
MFDEFRDAFRSLSDRLDPDERRRMTAGMRDALVHAKMALQDLRATLAATETHLATEQRELDTVRRRQGYAADIGDQETVAIAERFATQHAEKVALLESKRMVQQQELAMAEREYEQMSAELRRVQSGLAPDGIGVEAQAQREVDEALSGAPSGAPTGSGGMDDAVMPPRRTRAEREADAEARLADLKRRFGR